MTQTADAPVTVPTEKRCRDYAALIRKTRSRTVDHLIADVLEDAASKIDELTFRVGVREQGDGQ